MRRVPAYRRTQRPLCVKGAVTVQAVTGGLSSALTLTDSPPCCDLVLSSTTSFLSTSGKKRGKETPQGPNGSLTSLRGRRALGRVHFSHANWPLPLSVAKCGIASASPSLSRLPLQKVGAFAPLDFIYRLSSFEPRDDRAFFFMQRKRCLSRHRFPSILFSQRARCTSGSDRPPW